MQAMRAASATRRTSIGVLLPSDAKRSQSRSSGSVLAESIVDCVDGEISLPHHPNGIVPEKRPSSPESRWPQLAVRRANDYFREQPERNFRVRDQPVIPAAGSGDENVNDAEPLSLNPTFRLIARAEAVECILGESGFGCQRGNALLIEEENGYAPWE